MRFAVLLVLSSAGVAVAQTPRPLPFTYLVDTQQEDGLEIEQYVDLVPTVARDASGARVAYLATQLQTEIEYGLSDRLELGLYATVAPIAPGLTDLPETTVGNGSKQRLKYSFAAPGEWPIDVGLYGELEENSSEFAIEAKVLLQRRFGQLRVAANLIAEMELPWGTTTPEWILMPTVGVTVELTPRLHLGAEYWVHTHVPTGTEALSYNDAFHHFVGPAALLNCGRLWVSAGAYLRLDEIGRTVQPGELYGPFWFRTIIGVNL